MPKEYNVPYKYKIHALEQDEYKITAETEILPEKLTFLLNNHQVNQLKRVDKYYIERIAIKEN